MTARLRLRTNERSASSGLELLGSRDDARGDHFLRWRMRERIRRFLRPILRRPLPVFFVPTKRLPEVYSRIDVCSQCMNGVP